MKAKKIITISLLMAFALTSNNLLAQRGMRQERPEGPEFRQGMERRIPDLTPDQEAKIKAFRTKHIKEVTPLRNELKEKMARLSTLQSAEKQDLAAINKQIDEITSLKANLMKKHAAHRSEVASILTDEQRVHFNAHPAHGMGKGKRAKSARCE
jgi:Spy/CpxP family protein refolding chaperone